MNALSMAVILAASPALYAAEGMWTLDNLPMQAMSEAYGFEPDAQWIDHAMKSAVRLAGGCSGSFVSDRGLVLTNDHCVIQCVQALSTEKDNYVEGGFIAATGADELQCPGMEINRLEATSDVTERIQIATLGLEGKAYLDAKKAEQSKIESECAGEDSDTVRCDVVELYQGGVQHLYQYDRYQDVRLAFAPEYAAGFFGGDPDNFNFPRYNLDMGLLRVYQDGKPISVEHYFPINPKGAAEGELVMTLGHPGSTQRLLTVAQLESQRDAILPVRLTLAHEFRGVLLQYSTQGEEQARIARTDLVSVENGIKARTGMFQALLVPAVMAEKRAAENDLKAWVAADAGRSERYGDPWTAIALAQETVRDLYVDYVMVESGLGFLSQQLGWAKTLVRGSAEVAKADGDRLREYADARLPAVRARLLAESPLYIEYEQMRLAWSLAKLREKLGVDHPFVRQILGKDSPSAVAEGIVQGSELADSEVRSRLWEGGAAAVAESQDPAIQMVRIIDQTARELRQRYETEVDSVEDRGAEDLAQARFALKGTSVYPDATFSLRLSHGVIGGWKEKGQMVPPYTRFEGLYGRATQFEPFKLAPSWVAAQEQLDMNTLFNQVSTNDITGGNSGSPLINAQAEVVGLAFDGNIRSLGGAYFFDESVNRTVSVHSAAIRAALETVYPAKHLAEELFGD